MVALRGALLPEEVMHPDPIKETHIETSWKIGL